MMADIIELLNSAADESWANCSVGLLFRAAADEISRLRAVVADLEETLRVARSDLEIEAHDARNMAARLDELEAALAQNTAGLTEATVRLQQAKQ
jgi:hypothetical protein